MKPIRCPECGTFYEPGGECPNVANHTPEPVPVPAVGTAVRYGAGVFLIVSDLGDDGLVGLAPLYERVRVNLDDVEEI